MKVSAKEIVNSIPGNDLLRMAILKLIKEGTPWREVGKDVDEIAWAIDKAIKRGEL